MQIIKTKFTGLIFYKRDTFRDKRGYFRELFIEKDLKKKFVFDYYSLSKKNVLRGLHMQKKFQQGKYISVVKGKILDVVDVNELGDVMISQLSELFKNKKDRKSVV